MDKFREELMEGIEEISRITNRSIGEVIKEAVELSEKIKSKRIEREYEKMFRGWS